MNRFAVFLISSLFFATVSHAGAPSLISPIGINKVPMTALSDNDRARVDLSHIYLQMAWSLMQYQDLSKYEVQMARPLELAVDYSLDSVRARSMLSVVELRHETAAKRRLVVMVSGLFGSEWESLKRAKWFFDKGYDVLKVSAALSGSFIKAFPKVLPGDIVTEAQILSSTVQAYKRKYGYTAENQGLSEVIGFGVSYGASVVLKAADMFPELFKNTIALAPVYDSTYALGIFDSVMQMSPAVPSIVDEKKLSRLITTIDPQSIASPEFEVFGEVEIAKTLLKKVRLYCVIYGKPECEQLRSLQKIVVELMSDKFPNEKDPSKLIKKWELTTNPDDTIYVLTTQNDPLNAKIVTIGHTTVLERGGHLGFMGSDAEQSFIESVLEKSK